jgi:hypothetical protein
MAKETFYFSHDYNAMSDEKIKSLICEHGLAGYGAYWAIIEMLYNNANALRTHYKSIAFDLHTNEELIKSVINDFELFVFDGDKFGSMSVQRRLDERCQKSQTARDSAFKRWKKQDSDANALPTESKGNAIKERKVKEKKEKETIKEVHTPSRFDVFNDWLKTNYPNVASMKTQMTEQNLKSLIDLYGKEVLNDHLMQMENKIDLTKKYKSVYLTLLTWIKRNTKK